MVISITWTIHFKPHALSQLFSSMEMSHFTASCFMKLLVLYNCWYHRENCTVYTRPIQQSISVYYFGWLDLRNVLDLIYKKDWFLETFSIKRTAPPWTDSNVVSIFHSFGFIDYNLWFLSLNFTRFIATMFILNWGIEYEVCFVWFHFLALEVHVTFCCMKIALVVSIFSVFCETILVHLHLLRSFGAKEPTHRAVVWDWLSRKLSIVTHSSTTAPTQLLCTNILDSLFTLCDRLVKSKQRVNFFESLYGILVFVSLRKHQTQWRIGWGGCAGDVVGRLFPRPQVTPFSYSFQEIAPPRDQPRTVTLFFVSYSILWHGGIMNALTYIIVVQIIGSQFLQMRFTQKRK